MVAKSISELASSEEKIGLITAHESCTSAAEPSDTRMMGGSSRYRVRFGSCSYVLHAL